MDIIGVNFYNGRVRLLVDKKKSIQTSSFHSRGHYLAVYDNKEQPKDVLILTRSGAKREQNSGTCSKISVAKNFVVIRCSKREVKDSKLYLV